MHDTHGLAERYEDEPLDIYADAIWMFLIWAIVALLIFTALIAKEQVFSAFTVSPLIVWLAARRMCSKLEVQ